MFGIFAIIRIHSSTCNGEKNTEYLLSVMVIMMIINNGNDDYKMALLQFSRFVS